MSTPCRTRCSHWMIWKSAATGTGDMLPLSKERAMELYERDLTCMRWWDGGSAEMLFDREEFDTQAAGTMYAVFPARNGRKARSSMRGCRTA